MDTGRPVRWIEDRYEHFVASNHSRQHDREVSAWVDAEGRIHALSAKFIVDGGAYCAKSSTGAIEANMAANIMTGPYDIRNYRWEAISLYSNKSPMGPYRGVGRPGGCFAMERIIEEIAHELGFDRFDVRRRNLIPASAMPYVTATGLNYDSGDYQEAVNAAEAFVREHWAHLPAAPGKRAGIGCGMLVEQAGHGTTEWHRRGSPTVYGHEAARATLNNDGTLEVDVGTLGHGQGHATSYAQIAAQITSLPIECIRIRQGDTAATPYGNGTVASRSIVMGGGAVKQACQLLVDKARRIAAANLEGAMPESLVLEKRRTARRTGRDVAGRDRAHLDRATAQAAARDRARHVGTGLLPARGRDRHLLLHNPCRAGRSRPRHRLHHHHRLPGGRRLRHRGQSAHRRRPDHRRRGSGHWPGAVRSHALQRRRPARDRDLGDYAMPSAMEVPNISIVHLDTPSPFSAFGVKGMGEGGSAPPPAAVANAVRAALLDLNIEVNRTPVAPDYLLEQLLAARAKEQA